MTPRSLQLVMKDLSERALELEAEEANAWRVRVKAGGETFEGDVVGLMNRTPENSAEEGVLVLTEVFLLSADEARQAATKQAT